MKKKIIKIGILAAVFIVALVAFGYIMNLGNEELVEDIGGATLPRVSFTAGDYTVNALVGYTDEMDIPSMRDTITPVNANESVNISLERYGTEVTKVDYEILSLDGKESFLKETVQDVRDDMVLEFQDALQSGQEAVLRITLYMDGDRSADYYTRIINRQDLHVEECLDFANEFHEQALAKADSKLVSNAIEPDTTGDNSTFQTVTIHSDLNHINWGEMQPEVVGNVEYHIKETNGVYSSILLKYQVRCESAEDGEAHLYNVKEFFKIRYTIDRMYLLDYNRTMNQVFEADSSALSQNGIELGIRDLNVTYKTNKEETAVAFVQERELWVYNQETDELAFVFGFVNAENTDVRNHYDQHEIKIIEVDDSGNTTFAVYGYMNRGSHEGEVGAAVYYFDRAKNRVEEKAFIPSNKSFLIAEDELGKFVYYNNSESLLYVMVEGTLYRINLKENMKEALVENLEDGEYVASEDGHLIAFANKKSGEQITEIKVMNFLTGEEYSMAAGAGEILQPLGFVINDFVYGTARTADEGTTVSGDRVVPMYKLEIKSGSGNTEKTYQADQIYILDVIIEENQVTVNRAMKNGTVYKSIEADYITNNEEKAEEKITAKSYKTAESGRRVRLAFQSAITDKNPSVLSPKLSISEQPTTIAFDTPGKAKKYYVYGKGELLRIYDKAGYAVQYADEVVGVVVSSSQAYVWERGNRDLRHQIGGIGAFRAAEGENSLMACVRQILQLEGQSIDVKTEMASGKTPMDLLNEYSGGEAVDLTGCSIEQTFYLIGKDTPVIAMTDVDRAILLVGYNDSTVTYLDPLTGGKKTEKTENVEAMVKGSGNTLIGYVR